MKSAKIDLLTGKTAPTELSFIDARGDKVTVSKHASGLISCSCISWRIRHAQDPGPDGLGNKTETCQHIYLARRKGLK